MLSSDKLSVILGAGFSKPVGLPLAYEIKSYFTRDNTDTLLKYSGGEWRWIDFANETDKHNGKIAFDCYTYGYILNEIVSKFSQKNGFTNYEDFYQFVMDNIPAKEFYSTIHSNAKTKYLIKYPDAETISGHDPYCILLNIQIQGI